MFSSIAASPWEDSWGIAYFDSAAYSLMFYDGTTGEIELVDDEMAGVHASLAYDFGGNPSIAYYANKLNELGQLRP